MESLVREDTAVGRGRVLIPLLVGALTLTFGTGLALISGGGPADGITQDAAADRTATPAQPTGTYAMSDFPTNSRGLTYGSIAESGSLNTMPDLVAVMGQSGIEGFVYKEDLVEPRPKSPADAVRGQGHRDLRGSRLVAVYDVEGVNQIDVFTAFVSGQGNP